MGAARRRPMAPALLRTTAPMAITPTPTTTPEPRRRRRADRAGLRNKPLRNQVRRPKLGDGRESAHDAGSARRRLAHSGRPQHAEPRAVASHERSAHSLLVAANRQRHYDGSFYYRPRLDLVRQRSAFDVVRSVLDRRAGVRAAKSDHGIRGLPGHP